MLVLTRKLGESILIGEDIKITVLQVRGRQIRIGIEAPKEMEVHREEIAKAIKEELRLSGKCELKKTGT